MRLLVGDHLQAMLDRAEHAIAAAEIVARRPRRSSRPRQARASTSSVRAAAQLRVAAAGDELLRLDEELDLADAAAAELDVVAGDRDLPMAAMIVDLALDRMDVGDRRVVEIFAPDIRRQLGEEGFARRRCRRRPDAP